MHFFISYNREDGDFAEIVRNRIREAGFNIWMDTEGLRAGDNWREEIDRAIKDAFALIVVITPAAKTSEYVTYEWAFALGVGVKVIPVLLKPAELHPRLETLQYLDFTNRMARPWDNLISALRAVVSTSTASKISVPRDAPIVVKNAVHNLDSIRPNERNNALRTLSEIEHPSAIEALAAAVHHPIQQVRIAAAFHLAGRTNEDIRALPGLLEAASRDVVGDAANVTVGVLASIGKPAVPVLLEALHDENSNVRANVAKALGKIEGAFAVPSLLDALKDKESWVRAAAAEALGNIRDATVIPDLCDALKDKQNWVRSKAVEALGRVGDATVNPDLRKTLHDEDRYVRRTAARVLGERKDSAAVPNLIDALHDKDGGVCCWAAEALGKIGDSTAVPALTKSLSDTRQVEGFGHVCGYAARALEQIGTPEALAAAEQWRREHQAN
jgi:HEAT repeat protein